MQNAKLLKAKEDIQTEMKAYQLKVNLTTFHWCYHRDIICLYHTCVIIAYTIIAEDET